LNVLWNDISLGIYYLVERNIAHNVKALAMWLEFMAVSARLPMPVKGKIFQVKYKCPILFFPPEPQPNSIPSA
jgi:hypothetical protein